MIPMYFANPTAAALPYMRRRILGYIDTPRQGNTRPRRVFWCADNGCYSDKFDRSEWLTFLRKNTHARGTCWFATAPDVVGDAGATLARSERYLGYIRSLGYPAAFVAQDGIENTTVPWRKLDVLFIGGTTEFKLGPVAAEYAAKALRLDKRLHMGRVNSLTRYRVAHEIGCHSVDGTFLTYGPEQNLPRLLSWTRELRCAQ